MSETKFAKRRKVARFLYQRGWPQKRGSVRHRIHSLVSEHHPWYDWGHRLMILVGQDQGGTWGEPTPPTWFYRQGEPKRMRRTGYPTHPLRTYEVITDYSTFRERTEGLNEDQLYEWQAMNTSQDGDLHLGRRFWGKPFYDLNHADVPLLRRYLRHWRLLDWFGLRSYLYKQALHACVYTKKPFACHAAPPKGSGGYSHWLCTLRRGHDGLHRYRNSVWGEIEGEPMPVTRSPERSAAAGSGAGT